MITINNPSMETRIQAASQLAGVPATDFVLQAVEEKLASHLCFQPIPENPYSYIIPGSMSGAEMLAFWEREGALGERDDIPDSPVYAR